MDDLTANVAAIRSDLRALRLHLAAPLAARSESLEGFIAGCVPALLVDLGSGTDPAPDGEIIGATEQVDLMFGYLPGELIGKPLSVLIPERLRATHAQHFAHFAADPHDRQMGARNMHLIGLRRDGTEIPVEIGLFSRVAGVPDDRRRVVAAIIFDMSSRIDQ